MVPLLALLALQLPIKDLVLKLLKALAFAPVLVGSLVLPLLALSAACLWLLETAWARLASARRSPA